MFFDALHSGFGIESFSFAAEPDRASTISIELTVDGSVDVSVVIARMSRHPSITALRPDDERMVGILATGAKLP